MNQNEASKDRAMVILAGVAAVAALGAISVSQSAAGGGAGGNSGITQECKDITCKVQMIGSTFTPDTLKIKPGTTVVWTNADKQYHTVTAKTVGSNGPLFDSGSSSPLTSGGQWQYRFPAMAEGTYEYSCLIHPMMVGKVIVDKDSDRDPARLTYMILGGAGVLGAFAAFALVRRKKN